VIRALTRRAAVTLVRDAETGARLRELGIADAQVGGCSSLFLPANVPAAADGGQVLLSLRHPEQMNVSAELQWRVADDVRRLIAALEARFGRIVTLVCHDYRDLAFAAAFPQTPHLYFDDVQRYVAALRASRLCVTYRLHAFLPCVAFGTPAVNISYDERSRAAVATAGMAAWDIDLTRVDDLVGVVMARVCDLERYAELRATAQRDIAVLRTRTDAGIARFRALVSGDLEAPALAGV